MGLAGAIVIVVHGACGQNVREARVFDFAANASDAAVRQETRWIDFGQPFAREFLLGGWSIDEVTNGEPSSLVWAVGPRSAIRFYRFRGGDQLVRCQLQEGPLVKEPATIEVLVNGALVTSLPTRKPDEAVAFRVYSFVIPERALRRGLNVMGLRYSVHSRPGPDSADPRALAIAWDYMEFGMSLGEAGPVGAGGNLSIAGLTQLDYVVNVPSQARLQWDGIEPWGAESVPPDATFVASVSWDDGSPSQRIELTAADLGKSLDVALSNRKGGPGVVSFLAVVDGTSPGNPKGLTITAPRLTGIADQTP